MPKGPDPKNLIPGYEGMAVRRMNAAKFAAFVSLLMADAYSAKEIAVKLDLSYAVVLEYIRAFRNTKPRLICIADWKEARSQHPVRVAAYSWGPGPDVRRPPKKSDTQKSREYRTRKRNRQLHQLLGGSLL